MKPAILPKYLFLFWFGGSTYVTLEVLWRGYSHWTMLLLAGTVFIAIGLLNEVWEWSTSIIKQVAVGTVLATALEFITGCIVNLWLGWHVWITAICGAMYWGRYARPSRCCGWRFRWWLSWLMM